RDVEVRPIAKCCEILSAAGKKLEIPNFGTGLHREPLLVGFHMSLATEAHAVITIDNQPQMAATVIAAVRQDACLLACKRVSSYPPRIFLCRSTLRLMRASI